MKKTVKSLIIASSVAAIAGIGAVSFAAWSAGDNNAKTVASNSLGQTSVLQFNSATTAAVTGLLPIDQNTDAYNADSNKIYGVTTFKIDTSDGYGYSDFKLKVTVTPGTGIDSATKFYVGKAAPSSSSKGTEIDTTNGAVLTYSITADVADGVYTLYVCHDSANPGDMNKTFSLTLTLQDGTTAKA